MTGIPDPCERPWLTVAELAAITGEGEKALRAAIGAGQLPAIRVGRYVRIPTARLMREVLGIDAEDNGPGPPAVRLLARRPADLDWPAMVAIAEACDHIEPSPKPSTAPTCAG